MSYPYFFCKEIAYELIGFINCSKLLLPYDVGYATGHTTGLRLGCKGRMDEKRA